MLAYIGYKNYVETTRVLAKAIKDYNGVGNI